MENFKNVFLSLRNSKGLNQEEIAKALGVSKSTIAMWETGKRFPSISIFEKIADFFDVDYNYLYGKTDIMRSSVTNNDNSEQKWKGLVLDYKKRKLSNLIDELNDEGQDKAIEQVELITKIPEYKKDSKYS